MERFWNNCEWAAEAEETTARGQTLERALEDLLDVTRRRGGYSPREFVARRRAKQALRRSESMSESAPGVERPTSSG